MNEKQMRNEFIAAGERSRRSTAVAKIVLKAPRQLRSLGKCELAIVYSAMKENFV